ncbi:caprin homolog [Drosophila obscura]|uniref:caprin homolog n=1 Tax=Drosophila obscura TaxID=7282 RepID=UPI001BB26A6B|nr:caprin homolog [Drosophila obscura]
MPSAATTITNNNNSKEKRASVSSIGGVGVSGIGSSSSNGQRSSSPSLTEKSTAPAADGSQTDLTNNNSSASNGNTAKALKAAASVTAVAAAAEPYNPLKQMLVTIEHKIRNLEKRKTKLESYRAIQTGGKELSADQASAVAKYDAVLANLEFARELAKQMQQQSKEAEKEQKKQARKDNQAKALAETAKIREVLIIQNVLNCFNDEQVRSDFLAGENGAQKLESSELEVLEKFCNETQTRRPETAEDVSFLATAQKAAELFSLTINAKPKAYGEITFEKVRALFQQIQDCGYLDKYYQVPVETAVANSTDSCTASGEGDAGEILLNDGSGELDTELPSEPSARNSLEEGLDKVHLGGNPEVEQQQLQHERPNHLLLEPQHQRAPVEQLQPPQNMVVQQPPISQPTTTPVHVVYAAPLPPQQQQPQPPHPHKLLSSPVNLQALQTGAAPPPPQQQQQPPPPPHFAPTVRAVEQNYFKQPPHPQGAGLQAPTPQQQQQFMQQLRPLAEVLGTGTFHFLQDSELDNPEVLAPPPPSNQGLIFEARPHYIEEPPQAIQTLTFTNQSFPSQPPQPKPQPQAPPPQQQLFSPVLIHEQRQQQQQQPMLIMARLPPQQQPQPQPQPQLPPQQAPQGIGMQPGDVTSVFSYDSAVVTYEQQIQQQLKEQQQLEETTVVNTSSVGAGGDVENNDWNARNNDTNAAATAALTNVLKAQSSSIAESTPPAPPNKWSSEMNAMSSAASNGSSNNSHKQEWATPRDNSTGSGYPENEGSNHWNSSQQDGRRNSGNYQRRSAGGDDRRDRDRDRDQGGRGDERRNGGERGSYRSRQYGNSTNGRNPGGNSGVYFRNNESGNGGNNYYQNGGGVYNKESRYDSSGGGGSYRGQRGGNQQRNGNGSFGGGRPLGDRGRGGAGGQGAGGERGGYINQRQTQPQRMPIGLENKN